MLGPLICALLFAVPASADVQPSNSTVAGTSGAQWALMNEDNVNMTAVVPITEVASRSYNAQLVLTTDTNYDNITNAKLAFVSCDRYAGNVQAANIVQSVYDDSPMGGVLLYSTQSDYCNYTDIPGHLQAYPLYTATNRQGSQAVVVQLRQSPNASMQVRVQMARQSTSDDGAQRNPLGPSPSTAVAMIILYSITGIITALFLIIIITGAVRAHRHPERYGPRDVLGRPRQSRARGLGRAILDTLPIVKFGEKEPPKTTDVELGSTAEARAVEGSATAETSTPDQHDTVATAAKDTVATSPQEPTDSQQHEHEQHAIEGGIAPAQPVVATAASSQDDLSRDEVLGCSICTDDFEKGQDLRVLPCNHKFHPECVDPWLLNVSGTCPLCRVDLRPVTSNTSEEGDPNLLAPPPNTDAEQAHRHRSVLHALIDFRTRPTASPEERLLALRRFREQRQNMGRDGEASGSASAEDLSAQSRRQRLSMRFSGVFSGSRRRNAREDSPPAAGPSSAAQPQQPAPPTTNTDANPEPGQGSEQQQQR